MVNVKDAMFGARGDGVTDDTSAIQKAVNAVAGTGGSVVIPAGIYLVDPVASTHAGIRLRSDMTLRFEPGAVLQALPTSTSNYVVLLVGGVQNVQILGGTIIGNRHNNSILDTREGGIGLKVARSRHVVVQGLTSKDCWLDGFYIGEASWDVTLCRVVADGNRRQGMSVTSVDGLVVESCTFKNTTGFMENGVFVCGAGTAIEPNIGQTVCNVRFTGCTFASNATDGLAIGPAIANRGRAFVTDVVVDGNKALGNGRHHGASGIGVSNCSGLQISNNTVTDNIGNGIYLRNQANSILLTGNTVTGTRAAPPPGSIGYGILLYDTAGNILTGNTVRNSAACGIRNAYPSGANTIGPNKLRNNHPDTCP
ncbi:MAG: right-handed parallel beta-helix repeat-containing protein [Geothrix sp.]|nr:right-handed parallel beta-helix repeat-containing protein [Geothrix sp.]